MPTGALNCRVAPRITVGLPGATVMLTAGMLNVMVFDLVGSACDAALTETVAGVVRVAGAVYSPELLTLPGPVRLQVTAVLVALVTVTVNC